MARSMLPIALMLIVCSFSAPAQQNNQALQVNDYKIGSKDLLEITVFGLPELTQTVRVSEDGSVTMALLGKVEVIGLTAQELEKKIGSMLDKQYTKEARVTVFIKEYQKISVTGAVGKPGQYEIVGPTTLLQIIAQAGGLTAQRMNEIYIYRQVKEGEQTRIVIGIDELTNGGNPSLNIELQAKDIVSIPIGQTLNAFVYGQVKTPGAIPYPSSKTITLLQALAQAGGTTEWAKISRIVIKRKDKITGKELSISVNLRNMIKGKIADIILEEGDVVIVP